MFPYLFRALQKIARLLEKGLKTKVTESERLLLVPATKEKSMAFFKSRHIFIYWMAIIPLAISAVWFYDI